MACGDVHGNITAFKKAVDRAQEKKLFIVQLGDLVNYGDASVECVHLMAKLTAENQGLCVRGNHERKLDRFIREYKSGEITMRINAGLKCTEDQIESLSEEKKESFFDTFDWLFEKSPLVARIGNLRFVHGGLDPAYWVSTEFKKTMNRKIRETAYFAQIYPGKHDADNHPVKRYDWITKIKKDVTVAVGHDIKSKHEPEIRTNAQGGRVIFLDAGSSKGGRLLAAEFKKKEKFEIESFEYF